MNYQKAYQFDAVGNYLGETKAFESPLEAGVYHLPAMTTLVAPPSVSDNEVAKWSGSEWTVELILPPQPEPEPEPVVPPSEPSALDLAEAHIASYFTTARLLQMKDWRDTFPVEDAPMLEAVYDWLNGITIQAAQGQTTFSAPPHTFEELVAEAMFILGVDPNPVESQP